MGRVDVNQLRQDRQKLIVEYRELNDSVLDAGVETAENREKFAKMDADISAFTTRIEREESLMKFEADAARSAFDAGNGNGNGRHDTGDNTRGARFIGDLRSRLERATFEEIEKHSANAIQGWFRALKSPDSLEAKHYDGAKFMGIDFRQKEIVIPLPDTFQYGEFRYRREQRNLSLTAGSGGYTVAPLFISSLEDALLAFGGVRQVANVMRTDTGADLPWPTSNDTSNKGEIINEASTFGTSVDPSFGSLVLKAFKYSSKAFIVSSELLNDSAFPMAQQIGRWAGTRIGRIQNDHFTTGAGTTLPKGLTIAGVVGKTAASATTFTDLEVIDLQHSVDPAYRPQATWMFHDTVLAFIRKMKDATSGQYLWQPGMRAGVPDMLLGNTYTVNQSMSSTFTTGQKLMLYGDFSKYTIRDVREIRLLRLDELFAQTDQVGFVAFLRTDGNLLDAGTRPVKWLALA